MEHANYDIMICERYHIELLAIIRHLSTYDTYLVDTHVVIFDSMGWKKGLCFTSPFEGKPWNPAMTSLTYGQYIKRWTLLSQ